MNETPLMTQYYKVKEQYPETILLFRIGDFFETFEDDAKVASKVLGITLTKRSNGKADNVPLAGFPHHAIDSYLPKLVRAGYRVAICEQMENPKFAKGIVKREVVEIVTPGVSLSDKILDHKKNNYLLSVFLNNSKAGLSFADISTGEFYCYEIPEIELKNQIESINPAEILVSKSQKNVIEPLINRGNANIRLSKIDDWIFNYQFAKDLLLDHFKTKTLKGFGIENYSLAIISASVALNYLRETQKSQLSHIKKISLFIPSDYMQLDFVTKKNLEILFSIQDSSKEGTLISILDRTKTSMGGRMLKKWITAPLRNVDSINQRLESVEEFVKNKTLRKNLQIELNEIGDLERIISRVCTGRVTPREMILLKDSLKKIPLLKQLLDVASSQTLQLINDKLNETNQLVVKLENSLNENPPALLSEGRIIKSGYNIELDELRDISANAKDWIANFQQRERERTNIPSLKVSFNKVFGYYIEISNTHKNKIPDNYIRKQTLVNCERYITSEMKEYEDKVLNAQDNINSLEYNLFNEIRNFTAMFTDAIQENARLIGMLDCFLSLAECAEAYNYTKPVVDNGEEIIIKQGRHPVVERILKAEEKFTPNDCALSNSENQIILLTGPNMSGKSVYLRQTGLIVLLAQIGSFVPADEAKIGIVDRIYTRVGASDNITAGESTFLVEMQEAANILNNATRKSLILLDEIGRGTSTFDGISIAWAITEYLHENPDVAAKTLFATHYHELNEMSSIFPRIKNFKVEVREYGDKVIFMHKVTKGSADHSYGIQVALMAGLPLPVTNRAKEILQNLESKELTPYEVKKAKIAKQVSNDEFQINLFEIKDDSLRKEISEINVENLTPLEALNRLNDLKKKLNES
jgi:DNA mismatch repair protein MutS